MAGGQTLTTSQLCELIPDISPSTIYRGVGQLADAGILEVAGEQRVRGAVERRYRLRRDRAVIDADSADPLADAVGYRQHAVWLTPEERDQLIVRLREAILPVFQNDASPQRDRYLLSPILFPAAG